VSARAEGCAFCGAHATGTLQLDPGGRVYAACAMCQHGAIEGRQLAPPCAELALCSSCVAAIGGAAGGPDVPYRQAAAGEACGAADCGDAS